MAVICMTETRPQYGSGGKVTSESQAFLAELSGWYAQVPHELVMGKNPDALALYAFLDRLKEAYGSIRFLMAGTGLSQRRLQLARDYLVENGWLVVTRQGNNRRATDYLLPWRSNRRSVSPVDTQRITSEYDSVSPVNTQSEYPENIQSEPLTDVREKQQPLDPAAIPDWYKDLWSIDGFKNSLAVCKTWLDTKGYTEQQADTTATAVKGAWPGNPKRPYTDAWAVFRKWIASDRQWPRGTGNGRPTRPTGERSAADLKAAQARLEGG